jgi:hypothetical protein
MIIACTDSRANAYLPRGPPEHALMLTHTRCGPRHFASTMAVKVFPSILNLPGFIKDIVITSKEYALITAAVCGKNHF